MFLLGKMRKCYFSPQSCCIFVFVFAISSAFIFRRGDKLAVWRRSGAAKQILGKIEPAFFRCGKVSVAVSGTSHVILSSKLSFNQLIHCRHCMKLMREKHGDKRNKRFELLPKIIFHPSTHDTPDAQIDKDKQFMQFVFFLKTISGLFSL